MSESSSDANPLDALAEEFVARCRRGERPSLDEFIARRPDLADDIRDLFPGLVLMEGVRPEKADATGPFEDGGAVPPLRRLGDYRILREVGRGGMGVVYEAEQESLGRHVALKVLPAHSLLEPQRLRRFQREAKAAARLHHTNIVPVYGVGEADGIHYYVMQFIQGLGLDQVLAELRKLRPAPAVEDAPAPPRDTASAASAAHSLLTGRFETAAPADAESPPDSGGSSSVRLPGQVEGTPPSRTGREYWRSVARVGVQVGDALAYAHGQGVLHRDVKPSNLLLDAKGNVWVTDFGLAKAADGEDLTHTGDIVGTLRYMAPECFNGKGDVRSDVYSLGLTLYELLTLRPAFAGKDRNQLLAEVMHGEAPRPRSVHREVPQDLETVVLKAIARDPGHRYQHTAELAEDLRRFVDDRPVRARRVGMAELAWRWGRRNPAVAGLLLLVVVLLVVGTVGSAVAAYRFSLLADAQTRARADADKANIEIQNNANQLHDDFERLKRANALMESGRLHADAGQNDLALADYTAAVDQRPDVSSVWLTRGQFYMQFFCWDEAASDFERGFRLQPPADPNLWLSHAWLRLYVGDHDGYRRVCAGMLDKFSQTTDPATTLAIAKACTAGSEALQDYTRAIQLLEAIKTSGPALANTEEYQSLLAHLYYRAAKDDQARRLYDALVQADTAFQWFGAGLAAAYHRQGQDAKARELLAHLNAIRDSGLTVIAAETTDINFQAWVTVYNLGGYLAEREAFEGLDGPAAAEHPVYTLLRGRGRAALQQWDEAATDVERVIALRPDDFHLRLERGRLLARQGRWKEAGAEFDAVVAQRPDDRDLLLERGQLYVSQSQWELAAADFNRVVEQYSTLVDSAAPPPPLSDAPQPGRWMRQAKLPPELFQPDAVFSALARLRPHDAGLWEERAQFLQPLGRPEDALAAITKAVELRPDDPDLLFERCGCLADLGRWDEVGADAARALDGTPASPRFGNLERTIFGQLEQWDTTALNKTLELRPNDGRLYAVRARRCADLRQWDKVLAAFDEALKRRPGDADLRVERGQWYARFGRWKEALADYDGVIEDRPFGDEWFQYACLRLLTGDDAGYRKLTAPLAERYRKTTNSVIAFHAGRISALAPESGVDAALAVRWQEQSVAAVNPASDPQELHVLGLAHYRAGQYKEAAQCYRDSLTNYSSWNRGYPLNYLTLALVCRRLKQPDEERQWLDKVKQWRTDESADGPKEEADFAPVGMGVSDWLEYQVLRREAETALKEPAPKPEN